MPQSRTQRIKTISEFHQLRGLPQPEHPLLSVVDYSKMKRSPLDDASALLFDFYVISNKRGITGKMRYGQQLFDFDNGVLGFMSPNQLLKLEENDAVTNVNRSGWMLLIHPDFLWNTTLAKTIKEHEFFDYSANEALFLSESEEKTLNDIIGNIQREYRANMDKFSKNIIVSNLETLLNYSERFYNRQFLTREKANNQVLNRLEELLNAYFSTDGLISNGLPSVQYIADNLNISSKYLSSLLKVLTGQSTQQHIHEKLIEKAKEKLSTTALSVSQIAYELGFEHSQSFSKLFKTKTKHSPLEFRAGFHYATES
jgi:AraC-like DNA-binding protein